MAYADIERRLRNHLQAVVGCLGESTTIGSTEAASDRYATRGDLIEDAQAVEARESGQLARERLARQAHGLVQALRRLETGSYGVCVECDERIAAARLRAIPSATRCLACQQRFEDVGGHPGDASVVEPAAAAPARVGRAGERVPGARRRRRR